MIVLFEGLLAGAAHVLTGPDHLVGVAPIAVDRRRTAHPAWVGATWGLGHGLGVATLGALGQTLLSLGEVEIASVWAERLVGIVLIGLGLVAWHRARGLVVHQHVHVHDGAVHAHLHLHEHEHTDAGHAHDPLHSAADGHGHAHSTVFGVGVVHGLAGAGHFWAVLPSLAMPPLTAAAYIGSYLLATVLAMTGFGWLIGRFADAFDARRLPHAIRCVAGATMGIGVWWLAVAFGLLG